MIQILDPTEVVSEPYLMRGRSYSLVLVNGAGATFDFQDPDGDWHPIMEFTGTYVGSVPFTAPGLNVRVSAPAGGAKAWIVYS